MIKKFEEFNKVNESIFGNISRLQPGDRKDSKNKFLGRMGDDNYAYDVFSDMKEDFEKYNKDLRKVNIMGDSKMSYIFGKFDKIKNSSMSGNYNTEPIFDNTLNKKVTITYIKPEILLKPNELEKMFGVNRGIKFAKGRIKIEEIKKNPNYRPGFSPKWNEELSPSEKEMVRFIDRYNDDFKITYDVAKEIYDYFNKEYIKKYPQLKDATYKNTENIEKVENNKKPRLGFVDVYDKNKKEIIYSYYDLKDKKKIEEYIKNNVIIETKNDERIPITYFTLPDEDEETINNNIKTLSKEDIEKQNLERVYSFKK